VAYPSSHRHLLSFLFNHTATPEIYTLSLHDALPIYVFNPTDILWALATRVQPHGQISITEPIFRGNTLDPSLVDYIKTSCMIVRSEEHTSELQSLTNLVCRLLLEKKNNIYTRYAALD